MKAFLKTLKGKIILGGAALLIILLIVLLITKVIGGEEGYRSISVSEISGSVMTETDGKKYEAYKNMRLADGYALTTDADSYTRMVLDSDKYVKLEEKSRALFEALGSDKQRKTAIRLEEGVLTTEITAPLGENEDYIVNTPNAVLAVRGTFFKAVVRYDANGDAYTDVYTYGGTVMCKRVMPDGTVVDEEVMITSGYKARVKMDEIITVYVEELIEEDEDNVDPIDIKEVPDGDIVDIYNAAVNGHKMFAGIAELWREITDRGIDLNSYRSVYDGGEIPAYGEDNGESETEGQTEAVTEKNAETSGSETSDTEMSISAEDNDIYDDTEDNGDYPAAEADTAETAVPSAEAVLSESLDGYTSRETAAEYTYPERTHTEISREEPAVTEVTEVTYVTETSETAEEEITSYSETTVTNYSDIPQITGSSVWTSAPENTSAPDNTSGSSSGTIPSGTEAHIHSFGEYISDGNATCTEDGTKTAVCSCGEKDTVTDEGSAGHKEAREVTEASVVSEGRVLVYCSVCGETISDEIIPKLPIYIDDGNLVISETGYSQGGGEEIPYTGDYTISQRSGGAADAHITVTGGTHNISFNGVEMRTAADSLTVERGAAVTITGGSRENKLTADGSNSYGIYNNGGSVTIRGGIFTLNGSCGIFCAADSVMSIDGGYIFANGERDGIRNSGTAEISGGNISAEGGDNGIWNNGEFSVTGGNLSATGGSKDVKSWSDITVTGGSVRAVGGRIDGIFRNAVGDELECETFDVFPSETIRTFEDSEGGSYIYGLAPEDKASDGLYYVWKPVDFTPPFDGTVYMDDGSVTITADGITQGGKIIPWTEDIVISQKDRSTAFNANITVESGTHNITLDGVNINSADGNGLDISVGARVSLDGSYKENIIASAQGRGINNGGTLRIDGGAFSVSGGYCGLYSASATAVNGGRISVSGGVCDIYVSESGSFTVMGGSMKSENSAVDGMISNESGDRLECKEYSEYTGDLTFEDSNGIKYTYALDVSDSIGGSYYVWQPIAAVPEGVEVSVENFPDSVFREYVSTKIDNNSNGYLSEEEIAGVTRLDVDGTPTKDGGIISLQGVEYFDKLEYFYCRYNSSLTSLDVSKNKKLKHLACYDTNLTSLDVSNNTALTGLSCYNTQIASLNLNKNTALRTLYCGKTQITSLDVSKNKALTELSCDSCNLAYIDVSNNSNITYFTAYGCEHYVTVTNGKFDTKTIDGFDHTRVSNLQGAVMDENGVLSGITEGRNITYTYDCGQGKSATFTLVPDEKSTPEPESNGTLDLSAGAVTITEDGFVQNGVTTPWTGDYIISGDSGSSPITIESGRHNITLDGAGIFADGYGLVIAEGAEVTLSGSGTVSGISVSGTLNTDNCEIVSEGQYGIYISGSGTVSVDSGSLDLSGSNIGIFCAGRLEISGGSVAADGGQYGIMNSSNGVVSITGGRTEISGGTGDIYSSGELTVTGGSVRAVNDTIIGGIAGADGAELECAVYDTFPSEAERTFENSDGSAYVYPLNEGDRAADGKYYVWKPKAAPAPTGVEVSEENFPDSVFREYVLANFDTDSDGYLSDEEIAGATEVDVSSAEVASLQGIEYLTALETLMCYENDNLTEIDVSKNTALTELDCTNMRITSLDVSNNTALERLYCSYTQIASLDVSNNTALTDLYCYGTSITSLDISKNTALTCLSCESIQITSLDVSKNTVLTSLDCADTQITDLDVSNNTALKYLDCRNTQITNLDVSKNTVLTRLWCNGTQITSLNISNNTALTDLNCQNTQITSLDVSKNPALKILYCNNAQIPYVDIANNQGIAYFDASNCEHPITVTNGKFDTKTIAGFDHTRVSNVAINSIITNDAMDANGVISGITEGMKITYTYDCGQGKSETFTLVPDENSTFAPNSVDVSEENFPDEVFREYVSTKFDKDSDGYLSEEEIAGVTEVNVSGTYSTDGGVASLQGIEYLTALKILWCNYNANLTEIDVSNNTALKDLECHNTQIASLDVSNNTALTWLSCRYTPITSLDVNNNTALKDLDCYNTQITSLDVSNNTALTYLHCSSNQIASLDVSSNTALRDLYCSNTQITSLDVSNNIALINLYCENTPITSLDVSNNTALKDLSCYNTQITSLDVSNNTNLTELKCSDTRITSLDVSKNTALTTLWCSDTQITSLDVSNNTALTTLYCYNCTYEIPSGTLSFDITTDPNFNGFDPSRVSNVQGADFYPESGIFDNFTSDTVTYDYDCGNDFTRTFTLTRTGTAAYSFDENTDEFEPIDDMEDTQPDETEPTDGTEDTQPDETEPTDGTEDTQPDETEPTDGTEDTQPDETEPTDGTEDTQPDETEPTDGTEDTQPDETEQTEESVPNELLAAAVMNAAAVSASLTQVMVFSVNLIICLASIIIKLWR